MDAALFLAGVGATVAVIGANIALLSWMRSDMKSFEAEIKSWNKSFEADIRSWNSEINKEMKDFHGKLCAIDERSKKGKNTE